MKNSKSLSILSYLDEENPSDKVGYEHEVFVLRVIVVNKEVGEQIDEILRAWDTVRTAE